MPFEMYRFDVICNKLRTCLRRLRHLGESRLTARRRVCGRAIFTAACADFVILNECLKELSTFIDAPRLHLNASLCFLCKCVLL
jgi:hypothetical protein